MKRTLNAIFQNGVFKPLDPQEPSIPEGSVVTITVDDAPPWDDPRWMKRLPDYEDLERYLSSVDKGTTA